MAPGCLKPNKKLPKYFTLSNMSSEVLNFVTICTLSIGYIVLVKRPSYCRPSQLLLCGYFLFLLACSSSTRLPPPRLKQHLACDSLWFSISPHLCERVRRIELLSASTQVSSYPLSDK